MSKKMLINTRRPLGAELPFLPKPAGRSSVAASLKTGKLEFGDRVYGPISETYLVTMAVPVFVNKKQKYILLATIDTVKLEQIIDAHHFPKNWSIVLRDSVGEILATNSNRVEDGSSIFEKILKDYEFKSNIGDANWSITLHVPVIPYYSSAIFVTFSLFAAIFIALLIAFFGGKKISERLISELQGLLRSSPRPTGRIVIEEIEEIRHKLLKLNDNMEEALLGTLSTIANMMEMRDPYTAGHERRVARLARDIATEMGLDQGQIRGIEVIGMMHDVGKISIPAEILANPGKLSEVQYSMIKEHSQAGYDIIKGVEFPWPVADAVRQHHERLDGSGYPQGLKDGEIILEARIIAVTDVVEAMSSHRPYRPSKGIEPALLEIEKNSGKLYDPDVVAACLRLFREKNYEISE